MELAISPTQFTLLLRANLLKVTGQSISPSGAVWDTYGIENDDGTITCELKDDCELESMV